jgi:hypothetical protein
MEASKTKPSPKAKQIKARAWNADGFIVFFRDGRAEYSGTRSVEETVLLYPEKIRRNIMAVVLKECFPNGALPVATDLAFVVCKTRRIIS